MSFSENNVPPSYYVGCTKELGYMLLDIDFTNNMTPLFFQGYHGKRNYSSSFTTLFGGKLMILQGLSSYYERLAADPESGMPPFGTSMENISFALVLAADGTLLEVEDLREHSEKKAASEKDTCSCSRQ